jgi:hypothetical protein
MDSNMVATPGVTGFAYKPGIGWYSLDPVLYKTPERDMGVNPAYIKLPREK